MHTTWTERGNAVAHAPSAISPAETGEEHCQLCQAMHSALPLAERATAFSFTTITAVALELVPLSASSQWLFAMFSRPPPASCDTLPDFV